MKSEYQGVMDTLSQESLANNEAWKPCPLCGRRDAMGIDTRAFYRKCFDLTEEVSGSRVELQCLRCNLRVAQWDDRKDMYDPLRWALMEKWNRRKEAADEEAGVF